MDNEHLLKILYSNADACIVMIDSDHPQAWAFQQTWETIMKAIQEVQRRV